MDRTASRGPASQVSRTSRALGRQVIWLHSFGERFAEGQPAGAPRLPDDRKPDYPKAGAISNKPEDFPDSLDYDAAKQRLKIGTGYIDRVPPAVWEYEVSGKQVLPQWFSYRKANRDRPIIGERRTPSPLGRIQPDHWLAEYTTELINLLNVLGSLVDLEPAQAELLERICAGPTISGEELATAGALQTPNEPNRQKTRSAGPGLFDLYEV